MYYHQLSSSSSWSPRKKAKAGRIDNAVGVIVDVIEDKENCPIVTLNTRACSSYGSKYKRVSAGLAWLDDVCVINNDLITTSNKQQTTSNKQQATNNKQQATSNQGKQQTQTNKHNQGKPTLWFSISFRVVCGT